MEKELKAFTPPSYLRKEGKLNFSKSSFLNDNETDKLFIH